MRDQPEELDSLLAQLSQRERIDWALAEASASSEQQRRWLSGLASLDRIARFHADTPLPLPGASNPRIGVRGDATLESGPAPELDHNGEAWGSLRLLELLGRGSFGQVYLAWDSQLNRQVALKLLREDAGAATEAMLEEARLLARVEHPHVVRMYGAQVEAGRAGMWMEHVDGPTLARIATERGKLSPREVIEIGATLCDALASVHAAGVVHQDIKLQNLMQRRNGQLVLMDFGAGKRRSGLEENAFALSGTPRYLAPELVDAAKPSPQSDLWSVGVVLFRLLAGSFPVEGQNASEIFAALRAKRRASLQEVTPELPTRLVRVVERALEFDPAQRFASASEMAQALRAAATRRRVRPAWLIAAVLTAVALALGGRQLLHSSPLALETQWTAVEASERILFAGDEISPTEQLRLRVHLSQDSYVYVLNRDESGSTILLHPAHDARQAKLAGRRDHWLPGSRGGKNLAWTLSAQAGLESFLVIASPVPLREFEQLLARIAAIDLGQGIVVRPLEAMAVSTLTRGVTGVREIAPQQGSEHSEDIFDFARATVAAKSAKSSARLEMFVLKNTGGE